MLTAREHIELCLRDLAAPLWWPGLAEQLVYESGMYSKEYSTSQWLALASPAKVWRVTLQGPIDIHLDVELLHPVAAQKLSSKGAAFADATMIRTRSLDGLRRALPLLQQVPSLAATFEDLAKSIHILKASEPGFDVSYSDPSIPFSVFLNSSEGRVADLA